MPPGQNNIEGIGLRLEQGKKEKGTRRLTHEYCLRVSPLVPFSFFPCSYFVIQPVAGPEMKWPCAMRRKHTRHCE
jgi:hypothetical protein